MKTTATFALVIATAISTAAAADSRVDRFCGAGHQNELVSFDDVQSNPDGYYVVSLAEQISEGDPRIVLTNDQGFHLCTRPAATPAMSADDAFRLRNTGKVKFLFVPISGGTARQSS